MVATDSTFLALMLHPQAKPCLDPATKRPIKSVTERIDKLLEDLDAARERIILPTPALSEFLVLANDEAAAYLTEIHQKSAILIKPFDEMAAVELASMEIAARKKGRKRSPASDDTPWQKVKFDRQIVAIAKVNGARVIYTDDQDVINIAEEEGIKAVRCSELEIPPSNTPLLDGNSAPPIQLD
jgi:predicted nucleic acid-binding protein